MSNIIAIALLLVISQGALAKTMKYPARDCSLLLSPDAPALDFALSDLEGSFLELVKKVQNAGQVPADRVDPFIKDVLNMKASLLNDIFGLLPMVMLSTDEGPKRARVIGLFYQILDSLGVPPQIYGLAANEKGQIVIPQVPQQIREAMNRPAPEVVNNPIGFVKPSSIDDGEAAPEGTHRSVGFGPQTLEDYPLPDRQTGFIQRTLLPQNKLIMIVIDREKNAYYHVDLRLLTSAGGQGDGRTFQLQFNPEIREWIVLVTNQNNPGGRIGFL